jgi:dihydrodipicolinate synthase/N-acetylneuraminate lyase
LITLTLRFPLFGALKTILGWSGIECGPVRPPRRHLTSEEQNELRRLIGEAGFEASLKIPG